MTDQAKVIDLVAILESVCRLLSQDPLNLDDVRPELADLPLRAIVEPEPGTDTPAFVRLPLPDSSQLTLDTLREVFGSYSELPRLHRQAPSEFIFYPDWDGSPYTCAIIAETMSEQDPVQAATIRRDRRLD